MQAARGASLTSDQTDQVRRRPFVLFALVAVAAYALDQGSKQWALRALQDGDINVFGDWFVLHLTFNPGAAFSTGTQFTIVFTFIAMAAVCVVLWLCRRLGSKTWALALGFLLAGVAGNLTDRLFRPSGPLRGHVVDFLMLPNWPVFNVADICINIAAGLIILQTVRGITISGQRVEES